MENIEPKTWKIARDLVKSINDYDAPFIALSLELKAPLWTGDKKLINGLKRKDFDFILDTNSILKIRDQA